MQHNATKDKNTTINIYSNGATTGTLKAYQIVGSVLTDVTPATYNIVSVGNGVYVCSVTTPAVDCIMVYELNGVKAVIRVGSPGYQFVYMTDTGRSIAYTRYNGSGTSISTGSLTEYNGLGIYGYVFTDETYGWIDVGDGSEYVVDVPYGLASGTSTITGSITLDNNAFMEIAIPVNGLHVKEYLMDWIATQIGQPAESVVEFAKTFPANNVTTGKYLSYVPGVTNALNDGNFLLIDTDGGSSEINGFLLKTKDYIALNGGAELVFPWSTADGV